MSKTVRFHATPKKPEAVPTPDTWVEHHRVEGVKRLTVDIPASLHTRVKTMCAARGLKIADEVRAMLEERFSGTK